MSKEEEYTLGDEKLYTKKQMKSYAEHCMVKLLTKYPNGKDDMGEITTLDLHRIHKVLNQKYNMGIDE
tara:strand:+ start:504 stop:707 length:204 start_codon:yes stop_codon:yes gene_type:complete